MPTKPTDLKAIVRARMAELGVTPRALALASGVSYSTLIDFLHDPGRAVRRRRASASGRRRRRVGRANSETIGRLLPALGLGVVALTGVAAPAAGPAMAARALRAARAARARQAAAAAGASRVKGTGKRAAVAKAAPRGRGR